MATPVGGGVMYIGEIRGEWLCLHGSVCRSYINGCVYVGGDIGWGVARSLGGVTVCRKDMKER